MNNGWWKCPTHHRTSSKVQEFPLRLGIYIVNTCISNLIICVFFWEVFIEGRIINLHIALRYLSNLAGFSILQIRMLDLVLKLSLEDSKEPQTARILLYKLFYDQTDQGMTHFLLNLIKSFDSHKQPKRFPLWFQQLRSSLLMTMLLYLLLLQLIWWAIIVIIFFVIL